MKVWIVGKFIKDTKAGPVWALQGVFLLKSSAVKACTGRGYFTGICKIGTLLKDEREEWPGFHYPDSEAHFK